MFEAGASTGFTQSIVDGATSNIVTAIYPNFPRDLWLETRPITQKSFKILRWTKQRLSAAAQCQSCISPNVENDGFGSWPSPVLAHLRL
jgi:hypothetical protein